MATTGTWDYDKEGFAPVSPEAAAKADPYEAAGFTRAGQVKPMEALKAAGEGFAGGVVESVGVIPGVVLGAGLGGAVAGPPGAVAGGVAGLGYSIWAGGKAREGLGLRTPEEMRPEVQPWAFGGESLGGSVGALGTPYGAAMTNLRFVGSGVGTLLNRMIDSAKTMPVRFGLTEGSMATSAATAAASAEYLFPGETGKRLGAELAGGFVNPARMVRSAGESGWRMVVNGLEALSPEGRTTAAAKMISDIAAKTGEDVEAIYKVYKALGVTGLENLTPAQKTGSMALGALEDHLAEFSGKFDKESKDNAREGLDVLRGHFALLTRTGDTEGLRAAAQVRNVYYRTLIQGRVDSALADAIKSVGKITKDTPETRAVLSAKVRTVLDTAIVDARKAESELWAKWTAAEGDTPSKFDGLLRQFKEEYDNVLPEYRPKRVPHEVEAFINRARGGGKEGVQTVYNPETMTLDDVTTKAPSITVGDMYKLRSELLNEARQLSIGGDHSGARAMNNMAEAVLDDLSESVSPAGKKLYDDARGFTKEFHDAFTRSFVGRMESTGKYGDRIAPELTLRRALASGAEIGAVQLGDIEHATRFLETRGLQDSGAVETVMNAQERFLRLAAAESINPETGALNPDRLRKFMSKNEILMNRFPTVKEDLSAAVKTTRQAQRLEALAKGQNQLLNDQKVIGKILNADPVTVAQKALLANKPEVELGKLVTLAMKGTIGKDGKPIPGLDVPAAMNGLRASVYTAAINASTGKNRGELNLDQVRGLLFGSLPDEKNAMQVMQDAGVVSAREAGRIKQLFDAMDSIVRSQRVGTAVEVKPDMTDAAMAMFARMLGSGMAGAGARAVGSKTPSLIVHGAGAKYAEFLFTKMHVTTARQMLIDAISDPSSGKLELIMQQASRMTPKQISHQAMQMNAWAVQAGIGLVDEAQQRSSEMRTGTW